jgi:parvulin-like peptidyl-prolyl isomerase
MPALRFTLVGGLAFAVSTRISPGLSRNTSSSAKEIVIDAGRIGGLKRDYSLANHKVANEAETRALVESVVSEEIFFREALARGFEQGDRSIRWRLVQKMRFLGEDQGDDDTTLYRKALKMGLHESDPVVRRILVEKIRLLIGRTAPEPSEQRLADWYRAHIADYQQAERVTLRQVYFDRERRGAEGARHAADIAAVRAAGRGADAASALGGDPFVVGNELRWQGRADLAKLFGAAFVDEVFSMPAGRWEGPVESAYGWHLVFVEQRVDARTPDLAQVRSRVLKAVENASRNQRVSEFLAHVRSQYTIRVDEAALRGGGDG